MQSYFIKTTLNYANIKKNILTIVVDLQFVMQQNTVFVKRNTEINNNLSEI